MRTLLPILLILFCLAAGAQDKLFFASGRIQQGIVVSITRDAVLFRASDTSAVQRIKKSDLVMVENYKGVRFIFGDQKSTGITTGSDTVGNRPNTKRNGLGIQPLALFVGRATLVYERYTKNDKIGFVVPLTLTFDPFGSLYNSRLDTSLNTVKRIKGINIIAGLDVNFYLGKTAPSRFFIGPRVRYGTDLFLRGTEAYSLQTQVGWKHENDPGSFTHHLSMGFGFVRILSSPLGLLINPRQSYGWYSINYRLGIRW